MSGQTDEAIRWMHLEKGMSVNQIALKLGMAPGSVGNVIRRVTKGERQVRRSEAGIDQTRHRDRIKHDTLTFVSRDPCLRCGVRKDVHDQIGCKRWRGAE